MSMIKYRIHEVAKDFNVSSKVISQIAVKNKTSASREHFNPLRSSALNGL